MAFCSAREEPEEAAPETSQQSPAGSAVEQTGIFRIEDADGEILEVEDSEFVKGGIAAEVPPSWEPEALKAQGVALYTYYSRLREQNRAKGGDGADFTCNTEKALVYLPQEARKERWGENYETWEAALEETEKNIRGQTLQQDGALLCSTYFAISSGSTDAAQDVWGGDYSYLQPAASRLSQRPAGGRAGGLDHRSGAHRQRHHPKSPGRRGGSYRHPAAQRFWPALGQFYLEAPGREIHFYRQGLGAQRGHESKRRPVHGQKRRQLSGVGAS